MMGHDRGSLRGNLGARVHVKGWLPQLERLSYAEGPDGLMRGYRHPVGFRPQADQELGGEIGLLLFPPLGR